MRSRLITCHTKNVLKVHNNRIADYWSKVKYTTTNQTAMANLILEEACDRFSVLYDLVALVNDDVASKSALASAVHLSHDVVDELLSFMLAQGYVKTTRNDSEFRITALGSNFLQEFQGMRKFLS
nr:hypothetical protein Josef01_05d18_38 [uncultured archaeon]